MTAVLITAMSFGITSCSKDNNEKPDTSVYLVKRWESGFSSLEFKKDGNYSYVTENETVNGNYRVASEEKTTYTKTTTYVRPDGTTFDETTTYDATLIRILASGSSVYEELRVLHVEINGTRQLKISLYNRGELMEEVSGWFS